MRFLRLRSLLSEILRTTGKPDVVVFEEVRRHLGVDAAHIYGGCLATITSVCEEWRVPYQGVPVGTVKKLATGKGNADKAAMIEAARRRWPDANIRDDNEADARWIAECGFASIVAAGERPIA